MKAEDMKIMEDLVAEYGKEKTAELLQEALIELPGEDSQDREASFEY